MFKRSSKQCLWIAVLAAMSYRPIASAQAPDPTPVIHVDNPPNTPAQQAKHYVILVSLDGFRYDYPAKYGAPHLQAMAKDGASAPNGMLPSYPSLTFPNHLSLVTGLYPEHHGIVANSFFDPSRTPEQGQRYSYTDPKANGDGSWYGGTPLWVLAEQQGMRSACLFWPGSEAAIQGKRPSYYLKYDDKLDDRKRVDQVVAWLSLPPQLRPHFITLYYSTVDHAGHGYGPESDEVRAAVHHVDDMIGDLQANLKVLNLPVDLIVVADHGMATLQGEPIDLSEFADLTDVHTEGSLLYTKDDAAAEKVYEQFKEHSDPRFNVYRRRDVSSSLHYDSNSREGDPVIVPNGPYTFRTKPAETTGSTLHGGHGFDANIMPEMKAIFYADGPDIKPGVQVASFKNVNVYPFIASILYLAPPTVDGRISTLEPLIVHSDETIYKLPDGLTPPKLIKTVDAEYTGEALRDQVHGSVTVAFIVEKDGTPSHVHATSFLGHGLDEEAVKAVSKFRFEPAMRNREPVRVEVDAQVNFAIFGRSQ